MLLENVKPPNAREPSRTKRRTVRLTSGLSKRYANARQCVHCKLTGRDRPGQVCHSVGIKVVCGDGSPLYAARLPRDTKRGAD